MSAALADLVWPEAEKAAASGIVAIPIGATEQHGPHLPLGTDTCIAVALATALRRRHPDVVVAPSITYGSSGEHDGFAGTLSIGQAATELLVLELGRSASATFQRTLLICAHGGNVEPVRRAEERLQKEGRDVRAFFAQWFDAHAGRAETSIMLALDPGRVRLDYAEAGVTSPLSQILPRLRSDGVRALSSNGVLGDPARASAEEGRRLLEEAIEEVFALIDSWETQR